MENSLEVLLKTLVANNFVVGLWLRETEDLTDSFCGRPCCLQKCTDNGFGDPGVLLISGGGPSKDLLGNKLGSGTLGWAAGLGLFEEEQEELFCCPGRPCGGEGALVGGEGALAEREGCALREGCCLTLLWGVGGPAPW